MRRSRLRKKRVKSEKMMNFLAFFVFAPIVSVLIGSALVKYIILPQFSSSQKSNEEIVEDSGVFNQKNDVNNESSVEDINDDELSKTQSITIDGFYIYNIQLGSFTTIENANNFVEKLEEKNIYGYVVNLDSYKVFGGSYFIRDEAEEYLEEIKIHYEDSFISTFQIVDKEISCYDQDLDYLKKLSELHDLIKKSYGEEVSLWKSAIKSNDNDILTSFLKSNTDEMELILNFDVDEITSEDVKRYFTIVESIVDVRKEILEDIAKANEGDMIICYRKFMDIVFKYYETVNSL